MNIYIDDKQSTLPALVAAKQLVLNTAYPTVTVHKFITSAKRIIVTIGTDAAGNVTERWSFEDSSIHIPTVTAPDTF